MNLTSIFCWAAAWTMAGSVLLLAAAGLARRPQDASLRHWAWTFGFGAVAVLPLLAVHGSGGEIGSLPAAIEVLSKSDVTGVGNDATACLITPAEKSAHHPRLALAFVIWSLGTACVLGRIMFAVLTVKRWRRRSVAYRLPRGLPKESFQNVTICISQGEFPVVPITFGFRKPVILLPRSAEFWAESRVASILWHELGHIRRGHNFSQFVVLFVTALHWFNPIFWYAARRMEAEAEMAADDYAILRGVRPSSYAADLLAVAAEIDSRAWKSPVAHLAMAKAFTLEERLRSIIDARSQRGRPARQAYAKIAALLLGLGLLFIPLTPLLALWLTPQPATQAPDCVAPGTTELSL